MWTTRKIHQKRCSLPTEIWLLFDMAIVISDSVLPSASSDMWMLRNGIMDILLYNRSFMVIGHSCYWAGNKPALPVLTCFLRTARIDAST